MRIVPDGSIRKGFRARTVKPCQGRLGQIGLRLHISVFIKWTCAIVLL
jgi:hypothetical protein